ncbi:nuclear envelope integral membrane protein 2 [Elgaria multicarinata webbii]|uniref:nuclear envelope integral membrane protein 2 n=1 Tax=Elgaria multicarinata webbii TaxID=159646 RepID=UPI002FCD238F
MQQPLLGSRPSQLGLQRPHVARLLPQLFVLASVQAVTGDGELALFADNSCRHLKATNVMSSSESTCFCYIPDGAIHLKNIWSAIQVKINSTEMFGVVSITEEQNCQNSENLFAFLKCLINNIWQSGMSNEITISVDQYGDKTCFRVQPRNKVPYTVIAQQNMLDWKLFLLFVAGGLLFHFALNLSRSIVFYYSAGVAFGILATLPFLLLMLRRFIPRLSTFWILTGGCWFSSLYIFYTFKEDLKWLWYNSTHYILGYIMILGFVSFAICYGHGPLNSERSMNLLMWTLQLLGLILIYFGIAIPQVAYAVITTMICSKFLQYPLRVFCYVGRKATRLFKSEKLEVRYLTEEEYREEGETETMKALEELRTFCRSPNFPSWVAVVKLQTPQKFANFVLGLPHVSPEEMASHDEQYGIGGALLEQQLFNIDTEEEPNPQTGPIQEEEEEENDEEEVQSQRGQNSLHFCSTEFL